MTYSEKHRIILYSSTVFGRKRHRQVPNVHAFYHLHQMRVRSNAPLYETSAEPFEALYAVARKAFKAGTRNTPLQAMENVYLRIL